MKYTKKFNRSYNFYLLNRDRYNICGEVVTVLEDLKDGVTGKESFYSLDTFGVMLPTNEPDLLRTATQYNHLQEIHQSSYTNVGGGFRGHDDECRILHEFI